jgi:hypothetical protein
MDNASFCAKGEASMQEIWTDLRIAARRLRHSPGFVLTVVVSLTMAIAANLVVFGVLNAVVQRQMGIAAADRVWQIVQKPQGYISQSYPDFEDYRTRNSTFSDIAAYRLNQAAINALGTARESWGYEASGNYFDVFGVRPELGRFFHARAELGAVRGAERCVLAFAIRGRSTRDWNGGRREQASVHHPGRSAGRISWDRVLFLAGFLGAHGECARDQRLQLSGPAV